MMIYEPTEAEIFHYGGSRRSHIHNLQDPSLCGSITRGIGYRNLAGRLAAIGGGGWKNPYVTDGLVAMWDGEWNAGRGLHLDDISSWKDLVGNSDISFSNATVGNNFIRFNSFVHTLIPSLDKYTVDLAVKAIQWGNESAIVCFNNLDATWGEMLYTYSSRLFFWSKLLGNTTYRASYSPFTEGFKYGIAMSNGNGIKSYIDGNLLSNLGYAITNNLTTMTLGMYNYEGSQSLFKGDYYSLRVYTRILTDQEIAHNYAIDKARFNLP